MTSSLLKNNIHHTIILQPQKFCCIPFIDPDLQQSQTVKDQETFAFFSLVILCVDALEFFTTKLNGISFSLAQNIKCFFRDVGYQISSAVHTHDLPGNLFFSGLYLAVDHSLDGRQRFPQVTERNATGQFCCSGSKN